MLRPAALPTRVGPVEFSDLGGMVAIRCPQEFVPILQRAGSVWDPRPASERRWADPEEPVETAADRGFTFWARWRTH